MELDLKKTLEALLLSTAEPLALKDIVKIFARYHEERVEQAQEARESTGGRCGRDQWCRTR